MFMRDIYGIHRLLGTTIKKKHDDYEEEMPDWVYGEEALFLKEEGITDPPCWNCPKCHQDSLYRKSIVLNSK